MEEAAALGIELPPELLAMLAGLAQSLQEKLGARLDRIYPAAGASPTETEELSP